MWLREHALGTKQLPIFTFNSSRRQSASPQSHERVYAPASNQSSETPWRLASCERLTPQVYHARGSIPDAPRPSDASIAPARRQAAIHWPEGAHRAGSRCAVCPDTVSSTTHAPRRCDTPVAECRLWSSSNRLPNGYKTLTAIAKAAPVPSHRNRPTDRARLWIEP